MIKKLFSPSPLPSPLKGEGVISSSQTNLRWFKRLLFNNWHIIALSLLCIAILLSHALYVLKTHQYPEMDEQLYMNMAVEYYRLLQNPSWDTIVKMNNYAVGHPPFRPPIYSLSITAPLLIFGLENSYKIGLFINGLYYIVTIIALYFLARCFFKKTASVLASILFACYGWPLFYLHFTYSETATTPFIVLCLLFLLKSDKFRNRRYSILFGIFLSLGFLVRWIVPLFIIGPALLVLYQVIKQKKRDKGMIKNLMLVIIAIIPSIMYHIINKESFFSGYVGSQMFYGPLWEKVPLFRRNLISFQSAAYYFKVFEQLTIYLFGIFVVGLIICLQKARKYAYLTMAFLVPYLIFSFGTVIKDDRYIVPIYPFIALISATFIHHIKKKAIQTLVVLVLVILSIGNFLGGVWGIGPLGHEGLKSFLLSMPIGHPRRIHITTIVWPPSGNFSNADKIMEFIDKDSKNNNIKEPYIINLFSYHPVDNALQSINIYQKYKPFKIQNFVGTTIINSTESAKYVTGSFQNADYLLIKKGGIITDTYFPGNAYLLLNIINEFFQNDKTILRGYKEINRFEVPIDNSFVIIFIRAEKSNEKDLKPLFEFIIDKLQ